MSQSTPAWDEAAEDWLAAKRVGRRKDDAGHADRARRADLVRWANAINTVSGRCVDVERHSLAGWNYIGSEFGDPDLLLRALDFLAADLATSSRQRMLSTLRGFCRYLARRGLLSDDPTSAEELVLRSGTATDVDAFTESEIVRLIEATAQEHPTSRSAWPTRDVAIVDLLAHCGLRVAELCALRVGSIDESVERPMLRLRHGVKRGRARDVPVPSPTLANVSSYLAERDGNLSPGAVLFVRRDGTDINQQFVDAMLRRACLAGGVRQPSGAMAHALRHSYGARLARRGVPLPIIQQLMGHVDPRTTSIYTRMHGADLTSALEDAGLLA